MDNCIFCKIIKGEIPCYKIYEDEYTLAFLDISNDAEGHTLVIPKMHHENLLSTDEETIKHVMNTIKLVSNHYVTNCGFTGINIFNNNGASAGQTVMHLHFHIIPRKESDGYELSKFPGSNHTLEETQKNLKIN